MVLYFNSQEWYRISIHKYAFLLVCDNDKFFFYFSCVFKKIVGMCSESFLQVIFRSRFHQFTRERGGVETQLTTKVRAFIFSPRHPHICGDSGFPHELTIGIHVLLLD